MFQRPNCKREPKISASSQITFSLNTEMLLGSVVCFSGVTNSYLEIFKIFVLVSRFLLRETHLKTMNCQFLVGCGAYVIVMLTYSMNGILKKTALFT